jgi:large subunit ribosomal protein L32
LIFLREKAIFQNSHEKEDFVMPMPKKRISKMRRDIRRSHHALTAGSTQKCDNCGALARPHRVCASCGYYKGKEVVTQTTVQQ